MVCWRRRAGITRSRRSQGRPALRTLSLESSGVNDIAPLSAVTGLYSLSLKNNAITDVSPLSGLGRLVTLRLDENPVSNITPLAALASLREVFLNNTAVTSLSALTGLRNLTTVYAVGNAVTSLTGFNQLTALQTLNLTDNGITDLAPLVSNTGLSGSGDMVNVRGNPLSQAALCVQIPQLQARGARVYFDGVCDGYTVTVQLYGNGSASAVCNYNGKRSVHQHHADGHARDGLALRVVAGDIGAVERGGGHVHGEYERDVHG